MLRGKGQYRGNCWDNEEWSWAVRVHSLDTQQDEIGIHGKGISLELQEEAAMGVEPKYLGIWNQLKRKAWEFLSFTQHM